jgi:anthranilate/para-aminobenzoate synthase component I
MCKIHYSYSFSRSTVLSPFCWNSDYLFGSNSSPTLSPGFVKLGTRQFGAPLNKSTMTSDVYKNAVMKAKEHIMAGDIFQIVLSQRFERRTYANPFEVYRALRIVNPSPYMAYVQVATETFLICFFYTVMCTSWPLKF